MNKSNASLVVICTGLIAFYLPIVFGAPYMLSDDRIRQLEITPVLGRGYSIMTNNYLSTCLDHNETTVPSYNYDFTFTDFTRSKSIEADLAELSNTFAYPYLKKLVADIMQSRLDRFNPRQYFVVSSMRVERYYSSIMEEISPLSHDAEELLDKQDYVGFFMACGSNYVRSIRRAQEVTAVFTFQSPNVDLAQSFALGLKSSGFGSTLSNQVSTKSKFRPITESLEVKILAYGLGLNKAGIGSLIANSIEEYNKVMRFAFDSMTQTGGKTDTLGMVYGIELVPWVDNVSFQVASKIHEEAIEVPLQRSVMPKGFHSTDPTKEFTLDTQESFICKENSFKVDKFGYCCEENALYDPTSRTYNANDRTKAICRPLRNLDKSIVKNNMGSNGEFVTRLDAAVRSRMNQLATLEQCVSVLRAIPDEMNYNILRAQDSVKFDQNIENSFTVRELKLALDPFNDYSFVRHMTQELDEYMDMYYQTCIKALFGGRETDSEATNFMVNPWHIHEECMQLSCLTDSMRWNRSGEGGCRPSVITGANSPGYGSDRKDGCSYDSESSGDEQTCKYTQEALSTFHARATACWEHCLTDGRIDYIMNHFCVPVVTDDVISQAEIDELESNISNFCPAY